MRVKNIIVGAGPAGIQMADLLGDEDYIILEKANVPCSFFNYFPRHRKFISINKGRNLRYDWNSFLGGHLSFREYSEEMYPHVDDYLRYVNDFIKLRDIKIQYNCEVKSIEKKEDLFYINGDEYIAERVFFGIGLVHKEPDIDNIHPSIKVFTYANMPLDKDVYRDKDIIIWGTGNAAFETSKWLEPFTNKIKIIGTEKKAWQTHYPGHLRSVNFTSIDSYYLKAQLEIGWRPIAECGFFVDRLRRGEFRSFKPEIMIFCHGFKFKSDVVKDLVDVDKFPILTPHFESTKCKNLFFIGCNSQQHDYKKGTSAFIHGFRYNCQYLARHLKNELKFKTIKSRDSLVHNILYDLNTSSALFHRFDYFCILVGFTGTTYEYISEIPISAAQSYVNPEWKEVITIKLGYGTVSLKPTFRQFVSTYPIDGPINVFIHPIIQNSKGEIMHIPEQQFNEFIYDIAHVKTLNLFLDYVEGLKTYEMIEEKMKSVEDIGQPKTKFLEPPPIEP
jgi:thioredoxin reductase